MSATLDCEPQRTIECRQVPLAEPLGLALLEPHAGDALTGLYLVVEGHGVPTNPDHVRQGLERPPDSFVDHRGWVERDPRAHEVVPAHDGLELDPDGRAHRVRSGGGE